MVALDILKQVFKHYKYDLKAYLLKELWRVTWSNLNQLLSSLSLNGSEDSNKVRSKILTILKSQLSIDNFIIAYDQVVKYYENASENVIKWSIKLISKFVEKYHDLDVLDYHEYNTHNQLKTHIEEIMNLWIAILKKIQSEDKNDGIVKYSVKIMTDIIEIRDCRPKVLPAWLDLIENDLLQHLLLKEIDIDNYENNPNEFINKMRSDSEDIQDAKNQIIDFITKIACIKEETKDDAKFAHPYSKQIFNYWVRMNDNFRDSNFDCLK